MHTKRNKWWFQILGRTCVQEVGVRVSPWHLVRFIIVHHLRIITNCKKKMHTLNLDTCNYILNPLPVCAYAYEVVIRSLWKSMVVIGMHCVMLGFKGEVNKEGVHLPSPYLINYAHTNTYVRPSTYTEVDLNE